MFNINYRKIFEVLWFAVVVMLYLYFAMNIKDTKKIVYYTLSLFIAMIVYRLGKHVLRRLL